MELTEITKKRLRDDVNQNGPRRALTIYGGIVATTDTSLWGKMGGDMYRHLHKYYKGDGLRDTLAIYDAKPADSIQSFIKKYKAALRRDLEFAKAQYAYVKLLAEALTDA